MAQALAAAHQDYFPEAWPIDFALVTDQLNEIAGLPKPTDGDWVDALLVEAFSALLVSLRSYQGGDAPAIMACANAIEACKWISKSARVHLGARLAQLPARPATVRTVYMLAAAALHMLQHHLAARGTGRVADEVGMMVGAIEGLSEKFPDQAARDDAE